MLILSYEGSQLLLKKKKQKQLVCIVSLEEL